MPLQYSPKNNPRVIIIQKLYGKFFNNEEILIYPKHRFKKFIKDVVNGTIERNDVINEEINNHLEKDLNMKKLDKVFQVIIKSAIFEFLYKPKTSINIIFFDILSSKAFKYLVCASSKKKFEALRYSWIIIFIDKFGLYKSSYVADFKIT